MCITKNEGGMEFNDLGTFNIALLAKHGWRIMKDKLSSTPNTKSAIFSILRFHAGKNWVRSFIYIERHWGS